MNKFEKHPFEPFVNKDATILIIGSFPCMNKDEGYGEWFYSGSGKNEFWKLLSDVFQMPANNREQMEKLCRKNKIAITDIASQIQRKKNTCSDSNLLIDVFNKSGIEKCLTRAIKRILCTSKFVEKKLRANMPEIQVPIYALLPPSPAANRYVASLQDYKTQKQNNKIASVYDFKLLNYKALFKQ